MERVAVIGAGSWGTALAVLLAHKNFDVRMWSIEPNVIEEINTKRTNSSYLPGVSIPANLTVFSSLEDALQESTVIVTSVPAQVFRENIKRIRPFLTEKHLIVNTAKGVEEASLKRLSEVYRDETDEKFHRNFVVLSGPSHAEEVSRGIPTAVVVAGTNRAICERAQDIFMCNDFRVYTNPDVIGVELSGALKNVIAICTGISDGLGFGDNTKAAIMTRGLAEITRLGVALGANPLTFSGLAGVGDLIVTCTSMHSRNRRFGIEVGSGKTVKEALEKVRMVVEGYSTARAAYNLAKQADVTMPITEQAYRVLYHGEKALDAVANLMTRGKKHELEDVVKTSYPEWVDN